MSANIVVTAPVDDVTGEVMEPSGAALTTESMAGYVRARLERDAYRARLQARLAALQAQDPEAAALAGHVQELDAAVAWTEAELASAFSDEVRTANQSGITMDLGFLRVTWPKCKERWVQGIKPATIASQDPELAARLLISKRVDLPGQPVITVRPEKLL